MATTPPRDLRSIADLTRAIFGEVLSIDEVFTRIDAMEPNDAAALTWVGSVGYERHKNHRDFAEHLRSNGIERLIDVRELPISRRRGYAKTALSEAMYEVGIEYVHMKALGNPKPLRDMYKSGRVSEGREAYARFLLAERRDALDALVPLLHDKRSALMCVEDDASTCHRTVILDALREELGLALDVSEVL
ncbi:MAG: DUF488 family protein [Solirubrobacteraceae bacterium]